MMSVILGLKFLYIYYEFCVLGCQGDRMPIHKGFAPFLEGDKGDRRVTEVRAHSTLKVPSQLFAHSYY